MRINRTTPERRIIIIGPKAAVKFLTLWEATNNFHKEAFKEAAQSVEKGVPISVPLGKNPIFPPVISQMVAVGEETGKLEDVLGKVSDYFEIDASHKVKNFTAALGPIIIILLSGVVLFILMSVIL